jgi:hypothetical protein
MQIAPVESNIRSFIWSLRLPPKKVLKNKLPSFPDSLAMKASRVTPFLMGWLVFKIGKSAESIQPPTYTSPAASTAMPVPNTNITYLFFF